MNKEWAMLQYLGSSKILLFIVPSTSKVRKRKTATMTKLHNAKLQNHKYKVGHSKV